MQVLDLEECEAGSALVTLDMTRAELGFFLELGVLEAIKRGIDETKEGIKAKEEFQSRSETPPDQQELHLQEPEDGLPEEAQDWREIAQ